MAKHRAYIATTIFFLCSTSSQASELIVPLPNIDNARLSSASAANPNSPTFRKWGYDPASVTPGSSATVYVDNSDPDCTDNGVGSEIAPYCSIPTQVTAGSVVQIEGGPYSNPVLLEWVGTQAEPIFISGGGVISGSPTNEHTLQIRNSSHVIFDGIQFDGSDIPGNEPLGNGAFSISDSDHIVIRSCTVTGYPDPGEISTGAGRSVFFANSAISRSEYIYISDCDFTDIGTYPPTYETGKHMIAGGVDSHFVWILNNRFVNGSEDAIQIRSTGVPNTFWFISGNFFSTMGENAVDVKSGNHLVFSFNEMANMLPVTFANGSGSDGAAIVFNDDNGGPSDSWVIGNEIHSVGAGFRMQSDDGTNYLIGNQISDTSGDCVYIGSGSSPYVAVNTLVDCGDYGIRLSFSGQNGSVVGNIIHGVGAGEYHIRLVQPYMDDWDVNNLVYQPGGTVRVSDNIGSSNNLLDRDPELVSEGRFFGLADSSIAVDAIVGTLTAFDDYESIFGVNPRFDVQRQARPMGSGLDLGASEMQSGPKPKPPSELAVD